MRFSFLMLAAAAALSAQGPVIRAGAKVWAADQRALAAAKLPFTLVPSAAEADYVFYPTYIYQDGGTVYTADTAVSRAGGHVYTSTTVDSYRTKGRYLLTGCSLIEVKTARYVWEGGDAPKNEKACVQGLRVNIGKAASGQVVGEWAWKERGPLHGLPFPEGVAVEYQKRLAIEQRIAESEQELAVLERMIKTPDGPEKEKLHQQWMELYEANKAKRTK